MPDNFEVRSTEGGVHAAPVAISAAALPASSSMNNMLIEKLEGTSNYNTWKFSMKMLLTLECLWSCVEGTCTDVARDQRALARICLAIKTSCYQYVRDAKTAKHAWDKLSAVFEDKGLYRRVLLLRKLHKVEFKDYNCMSDYIQEVMTLVQQLADIGKNIDDAEIAELLLSGLPSGYDALVSNLETACMASSLSSELVRARLLQEEFRKMSNNTESTNSAFVSQTTKKAVICHYCKKPGHLKSKCFKLKRDKMKNNDSDHTFIASAFAVKTQDWLSDHMCNSKEVFVNLKDSNDSITIANNEKLECCGVGHLKPNTSASKTQVLKDCVPCLEGKLSAQPFPVGVASRASKPLELVYSDVCGAMHEDSWGGARYLVTYSDDYTRKTFGYLLKRKSEKPRNTARAARPRRPLLSRLCTTRARSV